MEIGAKSAYKKDEELEQLIQEGEKTKRRLQKLQQRRDHYARLYYQALLELDATRLELTRAKQEITDLRTQVTGVQCAMKVGGSNTTSPDSGASFSPGMDHLPRQPQSELHHVRHNGMVDHTYDDLWLQEMNDVPLRAPTGCHVVPPPLPQPRFRRSFSLSQQDSTPLLMNGPRLGMLSQEASFSEPRRIERTLTMPHRVHRPVQMHGSRLPLAERASLPVGTSQPKVSAFKQVPSQPLALVSPQREAKLPNDRYELEPFSLICDRAEIKLSALSSDELRIVCCQISAPNCPVKKIEFTNCGLGQPQLMKIFCEHLVQNTSITEVSLPRNDIALQSLSVLLDSLQQCPTVKELLLRHNLIGQDCASKIKEFLAESTIDALILTGNAIEKHSHLLHNSLPSQFTMECGSRKQRDSQSAGQ